MPTGTRLAERPPPYAPAADGRIGLGRRGEEAAGRHLQSLGYRILERRYRTRAGEIDFIARDGDAVVFIEVKTRTSLRCGRPAEAVDRRKRARISRAASLYLARLGGGDVACRFDVVEVMEGPAGALSVRLIRDAFDAGPSS